MDHYGASIERGIVTAVVDGRCSVRTISRPGALETGALKLMTADAVTAGDVVWFFVFPDGTGGILGKAE